MIELSSLKHVFDIQAGSYSDMPGLLGTGLRTRAGIDTEVFSAYSTKSASTSCEAAKGILINDILQAAYWSHLNSFTFILLTQRLILRQSTNQP